VVAFMMQPLALSPTASHVTFASDEAVGNQPELVLTHAGAYNSVSYSGNISLGDAWSGPGTDFQVYDDGTVSLPQFNPALGVLTGVTLEVEGKFGFKYDIDVTWGDTVGWDFVFGAGIALNGLEIEDLVSDVTPIPNAPLHVADEQLLDLYETYTFVLPDESGPFVGTGSVNFTPYVFAGFTQAQIGSADGFLTAGFGGPGTAPGILTLTYTYVPY
jgi:hypothetical protein